MLGVARSIEIAFAIPDSDESRVALVPGRSANAATSSVMR